MNVPDTVEFNGVTYKLLSGGRYYLSQSTTNEGRKHAKSLHVAIWEYYNGKTVPSDCCIHHIDGNTYNNDISNLECVNRKEHLSNHTKQKWQDAKYRERQTKILRDSEDSARAWHRSDEGRKWHSQHGKEVMANRSLVTLTCAFCGKEFQSIQPWAKYCSSKCYDKWRDRTQRITVTSKCIVCGTEFTTTKSKRSKTNPRFCSVSCRNKYAYAQRKRNNETIKETG